MKLATYLFCLSLAVVSGVAPAGAQGHSVYFSQNPVKNAYPFKITLRPAGIILQTGLNYAVISETKVTQLRGNGNAFLPQSTVKYNPGAVCLFSQYQGSAILLSCGGPWPTQDVVFRPIFRRSSAGRK
jgi:hypothetical protein